METKEIEITKNAIAYMHIIAYNIMYTNVLHTEHRYKMNVTLRTIINSAKCFERKPLMYTHMTINYMYHHAHIPYLPPLVYHDLKKIERK
jgi:hypothetical protein